MAENTKPRALHDWKPIFLAALADVPIVSNAARLARIDYRQVWRVRQDDPDFAQAWDDALEQGIDKAEQEAYRRAVTGFEEPVIDKGRLAYRYERYTVKHRHAETGEEVEEERWRIALDEHGQPIPLTVRKHSDAMLALYLKGRRKKVYADRTELTGAEGAPVVIDETKRSARVAQLLAMAKQRKIEADEFGDLA
jgi:hypothetical protein